MKLLLEDHRIRLLNNGRFNAACRQQGEKEIDFMPIVKLFTPWAGGTWLLSELYPQDPDVAFGLCDLGLGFPELGTVRISELEGLESPLGLRVERDLAFRASKTVSQYAQEARLNERIIV